MSVLGPPKKKKKVYDFFHPIDQPEVYQIHHMTTTGLDQTSLYMQPPRPILGDDIACSSVHGDIIDEKKFGLYTFRTELWNPSLPNAFFTRWIQNTDNYDSDGHNNNIFFDNLQWMRLITAANATKKKPKIDLFKLYIAYATDTKGAIVIATCVFVQPQSVYATSGTTTAQNGVVIKDSLILEQYVAAVVFEKIDPRTKGLLCRPSAETRNAMLDKLGHAEEGGGSGVKRRSPIGGCVGSNRDKDWFDLNCYNARDNVRDYSPSIIFSQGNTTNDETKMKIRRFGIDRDMGIYEDWGWYDFIKAPFWEPPNSMANPHSINNPQIPLVFFSIRTLLLSS